MIDNLRKHLSGGTKYLYFGIFLTIVWFAKINGIQLISGFTSPESLFGLEGSMTAIFAPLVFIWAAMGFMAQAEAINTHNKAIHG